MEQNLENLLKDLEQYLKENWTGFDDGISEQEEYCKKASADSVPKQMGEVKKGGSLDLSSINLDTLISDVGESFHETLFSLIDQSGMTDVEVYKRANMDRKLFSKIRSNPAYHPRKTTVLALCIALKLPLEKTEDLLSRAEYALSPGSKSDLIIRFFIERKVYDIHTINIALHDYGLPILE